MADLAKRQQTLRAQLAKELGRPENASWIPFLRAFSIGFASDTLPSVLKLLIGLLTGRRGPKRWQQLPAVLVEVVKVLARGFDPRGSGLACGIAMGGARWLEDAMKPLAEQIVRRTRGMRRKVRRWKGSEKSHQRKDDGQVELSEREVKAVAGIATLISSTLSSLVAITLLQSGSQTSHAPPAPTTTPYPDLAHLKDQPEAHDPMMPAVAATKRKQSSTLDLTLFFLVRATDTFIRALHTKYAPWYLKWLGDCGDVLLFQLSCWRIMFCWFYRPERLPPSYVKWISALAAMDHRVLGLLRFCRSGRFDYGKEADAEVTKCYRGVAERLGIVPEALDPARIPKIPCWVAHGEVGNSDSCLVNTHTRWRKAWVQSMGIYLPVFVVPTLLFRRRQLLKDPQGNLTHILQGSSRSAAFLATFVSATWGGVCLGRTTLFPKLFPSVPQAYWDAGFAPQLGCFLCGFALLLESKRRRGEMALYVAPRALYAVMDEVLPSRILNNSFISTWAERVIFASSLGIVTSATIHRPDLIRGVVKGIMGFSTGPEWQAKGSGKKLSKA